jgi:histidyl-tRNA synthetase
VLRCLDALAIAYRVTPRLVRGLDYYVRTTFELLTDALGAQGAVAGGGRYDGLVAQLGGPPDPGIGFAIGMERVALLLAGDAPVASPRSARLDVALIPLGEPALLRGLALAEELRGAGFRTEVAYGGRKLRPELERAHRAGTPWVVILGADELVAGVATIRAMDSGRQEAVPLAGVTDRLRQLGMAGSS